MYGIVCVQNKVTHNQLMCDARVRAGLGMRCKPRESDGESRSVDTATFSPGSEAHLLWRVGKQHTTRAVPVRVVGPSDEQGGVRVCDERVHAGRRVKRRHGTCDTVLSAAEVQRFLLLD